MRPCDISVFTKADVAENLRFYVNQSVRDMLWDDTTIVYANMWLLYEIKLAAQEAVQNT